MVYRWRRGELGIGGREVKGYWWRMRGREGGIGGGGSEWVWWENGPSMGMGIGF